MSLTLKRRRQGEKLLNSVIDYLYEECQKCQTIDEEIPFKLALAICGAVRRGETDLFGAACFAAFGRTLVSYQRHRMKEKFQQAYELRRCLPDFDSSTLPVRGRDMDSPPSERVVTMPARKEDRSEANRDQQSGEGNPPRHAANAGKN